MNLNKSDYIVLIALLMLVTAVGLLTYYFIVEKTNSCTVDPIKFGVEKIRNSYEEKPTVVYGSITLIFSDGNFITRDFGDINITSN